MTEHPQADILRAIACVKRRYKHRQKTGEVKMTEHPQADILRAIADGKQIQARHIGYETGVWQTVAHPLVFIGDCARELRIKPETININGHEVPEPVWEPLINGERFFMPNLRFDSPVVEHRWTGGTYDIQALERGLIHLTKDAAIAHAEALLSFTRSDK
jgi:hypothetical protein